MITQSEIISRSREWIKKLVADPSAWRVTTPISVYEDPDTLWTECLDLLESRTKEVMALRGIKAPNGMVSAHVLLKYESETEEDPINHPAHYTAHPSGVECIEITEHMGFNVGNAVKYLWRADLKGNAIEDLKKAAWYCNREIQRREEAEEQTPNPVHEKANAQEIVEKWIDDHREGDHFLHVLSDDVRALADQLFTSLSVDNCADGL